MRLKATVTRLKTPGEPMHYINTHDLARLAKVALVCGFDIDEVLSEIGVSASDRADPETFWDLETLEHLYASALRHSTKAHFPFAVGELFLFDRAPEVEAYLATSVTLREALSIYRYLPYLIQPDTVGWQDSDEQQVHLNVELLRSGERVDNPGYIETFFVATVRLIRQIAHSPIDLELSFRHQALLPMEAYVQQFAVAPAFGADCNRLSLRLEDLDKPRRSPSATLHSQSLLLLESRLRRLQARSGLEKSIEMMICHTPALTMSEVCLRLELEPRSLQRRLKEAGTSFNTIQAKARFQLARLMLANPALDIDTIAIKLGFTDRNGFSKAFSKWAGIPPSQFRKSTA